MKNINVDFGKKQEEMMNNFLTNSFFMSMVEIFLLTGMLEELNAMKLYIPPSIYLKQRDKIIETIKTFKQ